MKEAEEIMRMTPAEGLALAEEVKGGVPAGVRRLILYGCWRRIQNDTYIPTRKKAKVFETVCGEMDDPVVEMTHG